MLEAVNTVLQTQSVVRAAAEQMSSAESFAANPERVQKVAQAPYVSPYIHYDTNYNRAVIALRDSESGDFLVTIPSDTNLEFRARDEARRAKQENDAMESVRHETKAAVRAEPSTESFVQVASAATTAKAPSTPTPQQLTAFSSAAKSGASEGAGAGASVTVFA